MTEANGSIRKQCAGTRKDGSPCTGFALPESRFCFAHDPERAQDRAEARSRGGRNRAKVVRLRGLIPPRLIAVYDLLEQALGEVHDGKLDPKQAQAMASLARAMVHTLTAGEIEERLRTIEANFEEARQWRA